MRIKIDPADKAFSEFIRRRDGECVRCHKPGTGDKGIIGLQASHFYGRGKESTRFDPENVDALCFGCHQHWGSTDREGYRAFKVKQLGEIGFDMLTLRAHTAKRKDRKMALLYSKELLKTLKAA